MPVFMNPIFALIITNIIWGAAPPIFKFSLEGVPTFTLAFIRFFSAALLFLPFALRYKQKITKDNFKNIFLGSFWGITINVAFFLIGLKFTPSINVHVIGASGPVLLYFLSIFLLKEKPHPQIIKGMMLSLIGVLIIILAPVLLKETGVSNASDKGIFLQLFGNFCFVVATLGSVLHTIYNKKALKQVNPYVVTCLGFFMSAAAFFPLMLNELQSWSFSQLDFHGWVGILYGIFFASGAAYFLHSYGTSKMVAQEVGIFSYIAPIVSIIVAIPLVHEYPDVYFGIGSVLIMIGIYVGEKKKNILKKH